MPISGNSATGQANLLPTQKVIAGGAAGAFITILVFVLNTYVLKDKPQITPEIAAAMTTMFSALFSYFVPPNARESVI